MQVDDLLTFEETIDAPSRRVWSALTLEQSHWWAGLRFDAAIGAPFREEFEENGELRHADGVILDVREAELLEFRWQNDENDDWGAPLTVRFTLKAKPSATLFMVEECGFASLTSGRVIREVHEKGWAYHIGNLKAYVEA
jgi:uncharacterized protein YndB with AHSA1/START domain